MFTKTNTFSNKFRNNFKMANTIRNTIKQTIFFQQSCNFARWTHRQPKKVYASQEEYDQSQLKSNVRKEENPNNGENKLSESIRKYQVDKINFKQPSGSESVNFAVRERKQHKPLVAKHQGKKTSVDMLETVIDEDGNFVYTKMENSDPRVGMLLTQVKTKKEPDNSLMLLEGKRLIQAALQAGCALKYLIFTRTKDLADLKPLLPKLGAQLYKMPYREMQMWSDLTTTPGIMAVCRTPNVQAYAPASPLPLTVVCDNVREPGNLGTVLRLCAGAGVAKVVLTRGCVRLWGAKVLRSAAGGHFKLRIESGAGWEEVEAAIAADAAVYIADNRVGSKDEALAPIVPYYGVSFARDRQHVVVVGGETEGVSEEAYKLALARNGVRLNIPLSNDIESINVGAALGVILFEMRRQLIRV